MPELSDGYDWQKLEQKKEETEYQEAEIVRFEEPGDKFIGIYSELVENPDTNGDWEYFWKFTSILPEDAEEYIIFPTSVLKSKMELVEIGTPLKIIYNGKKKSKKSRYSYKDFTFYTGEGE